VPQINMIPYLVTLYWHWAGPTSPALSHILWIFSKQHVSIV